MVLKVVSSIYVNFINTIICFVRRSDTSKEYIVKCISYMFFYNHNHTNSFTRDMVWSIVYLSFYFIRLIAALTYFTTTHVYTKRPFMNNLRCMFYCSIQVTSSTN